jgi:hypothetical protein
MSYKLNKWKNNRLFQNYKEHKLMNSYHKIKIIKINIVIHNQKKEKKCQIIFNCNKYRMKTQKSKK